MKQLPPENERARRENREAVRANIQRHLGVEVDLETVDASFTGTEWAEGCAEWAEIRNQLFPGDLIREFDTVEPCGSFVSGERGYAIVRDGNVVLWIVTVIDA
jgi:hypothetical protein